MSYKLTGVNATNFAGFDEISVSFDPNINYLVGPNGASKTTLGLNLLWVTMQGAGSKSASKDMSPLIAERYMVIGDAAKSGKTGIILHDTVKNIDIKVTRKITKDGTTLEFDAPDGIMLDQYFLNELWNIFLVSPKRFLSLTPREQSIALGIDLTDIDNKIKALKTEYTNINRDIKNIGEIVPVLFCEEVDVAAKVGEKARRVKFNDEQIRRKESRDKAIERLNQVEEQFKSEQQSIQELILLRDTITSTCRGFKSAGGIGYLKTVFPMLKNEINQFEDNQTVLRDSITEESKHLNALKPAEPLLDITELDNEIAQASVINVNASKYSEYLKAVEKKEKLSKALQDNKDMQTAMDQERNAKIQSFNLPFNNAAINEDGELTVDGRYVKPPYFSAGELCKMVPMLIISSMRNSGKEIQFPYVFVEDFSLLDEDSQKDVIDYFTENNIQCCLELVSKVPSDKPNSIFLKDSVIQTK